MFGFIQGGQTYLTRLRMLNQVIYSLLKVVLVVWLVSFLALLFWRHSWQDLWQLFWLFKGELRSEYLSFLPSDSWVLNKNGDLIVVRDSWFCHHPSSILLKQRLLLSLVQISWQSFFLSISSGAILGISWLRRGLRQNQSKLLQGLPLVTVQALNNQVKKRGLSPYGIGGVLLPKDAEYKHFMVTGTTGAGKSNLIHDLLLQIRTLGDRAIVIDTTGGMVSRFYQSDRDILLNPFDARSAKWNLWAECQDDLMVAEIAESLIPEQSFESFWVNSARQVLMGALQYLLGRGIFSYQTLLNLLLYDDLAKVHEQLQGTIAASLLDPSVDKMALSIRATLANHLKVLETWAEVQDLEDGFSLLSAVRGNNKDWIFCSCPPHGREYLRPLLATFVSLSIKGLMLRRESDATSSLRTWLIIDELAAMAKIPTLLTGLAEARKYGGCIVLGFQDLGQLQAIYGNAISKSLSNLTNTKALFRVQDGELANHLSRCLGEQEQEETQTSLSYGAHQYRDGVNIQHHKQLRPVVNPASLMQLDDLQCYLKLPGNLPVTKLTMTYHHLPLVNPVFVVKE